MLDREKVKTGIFEMLQRNTWKDIDKERHRFQPVLNDVLALLKEQEAKKGHWISSAGDDKCSVCGATYSDLYPDYQNTHYCPNCGAKMEGR